MADENASQPQTPAEGAEGEKVSRVKGITDPQFDGIGKRTLEAWVKYWGDPEKYGKDGHDEAKATKDLALINAEIEARAKAEVDNKAAREQAAKDKEAAKAAEDAKAPAAKAAEDAKAPAGDKS